MTIETQLKAQNGSRRALRPFGRQRGLRLSRSAARFYGSVARPVSCWCRRVAPLRRRGGGHWSGRSPAGLPDVLAAGRGLAGPSRARDVARAGSARGRSAGRGSAAVGARPAELRGRGRLRGSGGWGAQQQHSAAAVAAAEGGGLDAPRRPRPAMVQPPAPPEGEQQEAGLVWLAGLRCCTLKRAEEDKQG